MHRTVVKYNPLWYKTDEICYVLRRHYMKNVQCYVFFLFIVLFGLTACDQFQGTKSDSPVIATIDKDEITQEDFLQGVSRVPEWARNQFREEEGKKKFLEELIKRELIFEHAKQMKLDNNKEYINRVEEFKKMTLVSLVLKKEVEEKAIVDDSEVKTFYEQNADKFTIGTQIKASHILVETENEAKDILGRIKKGERFSELAKSLSKDKGSAEKGGDLGYFSRGKMVPEFERAALGLKPGEVSEPVRTRFGYHVIKLTDMKMGNPASFEQSEESIRKQLLAEKRKRLFDSLVEKLEGKSVITKDDAALAAIPLPWEKPEESPPEPKEQ